MPDISAPSDAERTRRLQRKIKNNLTTSLQRLTLSTSPTTDAASILSSTSLATSDSSPPTVDTLSVPHSNSSTMSASNGYASAARVPTQAPNDTDSGNTGLPTDDATGRHFGQQAALGSSFNSANGASSAPTSNGIGSTIGPVTSGHVSSVEKLTYSNYTFWHMSLRLSAALYRCEEHIISDPPPPPDTDGADNHRRSAAQAWLLLTQSIPVEIRNQLTTEDLSSTPYTICRKLKEIVISRPENSRVYLMSRAQNTILRRGDSMSQYLATHEDIRLRMILVDHIKEDDEASTILFILCGLRHNPDYAEVHSALTLKSSQSALTLAALKHDLLREEQYQKTKYYHVNSNTRSFPLSTSPNGGGVPNSNSSNINNSSNGSRDGGNVVSSTRPLGPSNGAWCTFHEVSTHATEQCQAKARQDAMMGNKWCAFHETNTHNTEECKAKARQDSQETKWCSFHESTTHNTDDCQAKARVDDLNGSGKWCAFHESRTHNTEECHAKARQEAMYAR